MSLKRVNDATPISVNPFDDPINGNPFDFYGFFNFGNVHLRVPYRHDESLGLLLPRDTLLYDHDHHDEMRITAQSVHSAF